MRKDWCAKAAKAACVLGLTLALGAALVSLGRAAQRTIAYGAGVTVAWSGTRNTVFIPGWGYWVFYKDVNPDRMAWRWSKDGMEWSAAQEVFPYMMLAPDAAAGTGSVFYYQKNDNTHWVYAAAPDGGIDVNASGQTTTDEGDDSSGNKVFIRRGMLTSTGTITWDALGIKRQRMKITENGRLNCQVSEADGCGRGVGLIDPIPSKSIAISYSSGTGVTNGYVSVFSDARHSAGDHMPALVGITNIKDDLSDYLVPDTPNVWTVCMCGAGIEQYDSGNTANDSLTLPVAVPIVNKAGAATLYPRTLVAWRLPNTGINNNTSNDIIGGEFIYRLNNTNWGRAVDTALH